jgi:hypothetical protein
MLLTTDSRGRATLGKKDTTDKVTELDGGVLLLEPAQVMTAAELAYLTNTALQQQVAQSQENRATSVPYQRRT